jgi:hypothetical protein
VAVRPALKQSDAQPMPIASRRRAAALAGYVVAKWSR